MAFETRFAVALPFGACVGVALPELDRNAPAEVTVPAELHPREAAFARDLAPLRRPDWIGGRVALRRALAAAGVLAPHAILAAARGAPDLPEDAAGSISHTRGLAVALAAPSGTPPATLGIDVEAVRPLHAGVDRRVLTDEELTELAGLPDGPVRDAAVLLRFAAKEAIYKALAPWVRRFVSFQEARIVAVGREGLVARLTPTPGEGPFRVALHDAGAHAGPGFVMTAARVTCADV